MCQVPITATGTETDMWLSLDTLILFNRKSYMRTPTTPLDLPMSDLERSSSRSRTHKNLQG